MTSSFLNLKLYNVHFLTNNDCIDQKGGYKKEIGREVSRMRKHEVERDGIRKHLYQTHAQTNVLATEFSLTTLFALICHGAKNTCRDHGRVTVDSSRTAGQQNTLELHAFVRHQ
jgi:hypothetical protein